MVANVVIGMSDSQLSEHIEAFPVVLLSPTLRQRHVLLAQLMQADEQVAFYALTEPDMQLHAFLRGLIGGLKTLYPDLGQQTEQALSHKRPRPDDLALALFADLAQVQPSPGRLVIDNADYLALDDTTQHFL